MNSTEITCREWRHNEDTEIAEALAVVSRRDKLLWRASLSLYYAGGLLSLAGLVAISHLFVRFPFIGIVLLLFIGFPLALYVSCKLIGGPSSGFWRVVLLPWRPTRPSVQELADALAKITVERREQAESIRAAAKAALAETAAGETGPNATTAAACTPAEVAADHPKADAKAAKAQAEDAENFVDKFTKPFPVMVSDFQHATRTLKVSEWADFLEVKAQNDSDGGEKKFKDIGDNLEALAKRIAVVSTGKPSVDALAAAIQNIEEDFEALTKHKPAVNVPSAAPQNKAKKIAAQRRMIKTLEWIAATSARAIEVKDPYCPKCFVGVSERAVQIP